MARLLGLLLLMFAGLAQAAQTDLQGLRVWASPDKTRVVFDISKAVEHKLFTLDGPDRLVIDISKTRLSTKLDSTKGGIIKGVRSAPRNGKDLRVVLDLSTAVQPKSFVLKPNSKYGHRLVIDLAPKQASKNTATRKTVKRTAPENKGARDIIIAIDAGHGGDDPGAIGYRGTYEKDAVLQIARRLERLVKKERGMRPVMIRTGDYYIGLRQRMEKARKARADLFVSIHADAFRDPKVSGASVYTVSLKGASSEAARWLADQENASDLIGGVSLEDKDDVLASVLLDLSQSYTIESSQEAADQVVKKLGRVTHMHKRRVQQAGFVVLKSPDIPSMLVETAFISNPKDERRLRNPKSQETMAKAILAGVREYFQRKPPPGTWLAERRRHVIARGDTLSELAERYNVSVATLKTANGLRSNTLKIGQVLDIPPS